MTRQIMQPEGNPESLSVWWEGSFLSITDKAAGACIQISGETAVELAKAIMKADQYEAIGTFECVSKVFDHMERSR